MYLNKSDELLLIIDNNTDTKISQTKTRALKSIDLKSIDTFYSNPQFLLQEEKHLIAVTKNKISNSNFFITDQSKIFAIYTPSYWQDPDTKKTVTVRRKNKFKSK